MKIPEPWMFGVEVTANDLPIGPGVIGKFTLRARLRMKWRTLRGKPAWTILPYADGPAEEPSHNPIDQQPDEETPE